MKILPATDWFVPVGNSAATMRCVLMLSCSSAAQAASLPRQRRHPHSFAEIKLSPQTHLDGNAVFAGMVPLDQAEGHDQLEALIVSTSTSDMVIQGIDGLQHTNKNGFAACGEKFSGPPESRKPMEKSALAAGRRFSVETFAQEIEAACQKCIHVCCWKEQGSA